MRNALGRLIRSVGLNVKTFASARDYLDYDHPDPPACLVLDVLMPGLDGLELQEMLVAAGSQTPRFIRRAHRSDKEVYVWTVAETGVLPATAALALALVIGACASSGGRDTTGGGSPPDPSQAPPIGSWTLESFAAAEWAEAPLPGIAFSLEIVKGGRVAGSSGCNRFTGRYEAGRTGSLSFGTLASTRMACPEPVMGQERRYLSALDHTTGFGLAGGKLRLTDEEGNILLVFVRGTRR